MKCVVLANGEYGEDLDCYRPVLQEADLILCADGGANYAYILSLVPDCIIGDMDSINNKVRDHFTNFDVPVKKYPRQKDFTDTQLALSEAEQMGADEIILIGSMGRRLDHTLSNLYSCMELVEKGLKVSHYAPEVEVHLVSSELKIMGRPGDVVSVLLLSDYASGVCERGFEFPLENALLSKGNPYTVSNRMTGEEASITLEHGILAIFHYYK